MSNNAVYLSQVSKRFGKHQVLNNINLKVPEQSIFAFLGNNGEGKSTAIRLIVGLLKPDAGAIEVLGRNILQHRQTILREIGCLVEAPSVYPNLTAREFLSIGCSIKNLPTSDIDRVLELVQLHTDKHRRIGQFSLGMKQRIALAHALLGTPKLLILDEPTNGLDPAGIQEIRQLLLQLPEQTQCTVFVSSHQLDEVEKIATHVALLKNGQIQFQSKIQDIFSRQTGRLVLHVDDAYRAVDFLQNSPYTAIPISTTQFYVEDIAATSTHQINSLLMQSSIRLDQSIFETSSLEQWFAQSTKEKQMNDEVTQ
jgi:ABC-type multidrug transport system ATPase subunit